MLERVVANTPKEYSLLHFRNIAPDSVGEGICYVRGGTHKFTRMDKPFIVLYLQDVDGLILPGYIFNVEHFKEAGLELTKAIHSLVKVEYQENYHPRYGMSIIITKISLVEHPDASLFSLFVKTAEEAKQAYNNLQQSLVEVLGVKVSIPYTICTESYMDYSQGEIGGLAIHYWDMFNILKTYASKFSKEDQKQLWGTFVLYFYTHSNFICAEANGEADIQLVTKLTTIISTVKTKLNMGEGALEVVHIFFGYQPKDIFVRIVDQVSKSLIRNGKEINMYSTLPLTREGDAGYGVIRRYN